MLGVAGVLTLVLTVLDPGSGTAPARVAIASIAAPVGAVTVPAAELAAPGLATATVRLLATGSATTARGFELEDSRIMGITPRGLRVYLARNPGNPAALAPAIVSAVTAVRATGLDVSWGGYGNPRAAVGFIVVSFTPPSCPTDGSVLAYTATAKAPLSNGRLMVTGAQVTVCPLTAKYPAWVLTAAIKHELGHALGLNHFSGPYRGVTQIMNYAITASDRANRYQAGDLNGLRYLAAGSAVLRGRAATGLVSRPLRPIAGALRLHRVTRHWRLGRVLAAR